MSENILTKIDKTFNINQENGLYSFDNIENINILPQRLIRSLDVIKPNYIFIFNNNPIILFFDNTKTKEQISKECWNFAQSPIIVIENDSDLEVYNGFDYVIEKKSLSIIGDIDNINYLSIISGKYFENTKKIFENKNNKLDRNLLKNIKDAREELLKLGVDTHMANSLLGRIIFIRYLIDREISLKFENKHKALSKDDLEDILASKTRTYNLFRYLKSDDGFNGDWFPIDEEKERLIDEKHLLVLKNLISGYDFKKHQGSLFDVYDFSIIPIEFISNVYESFIGDEKQKKDGAYYTPTFLVDYILKYTVDEYFKTNPNKYNCKVLDPACGSGIFLVETFRKLVAQYEKVTKKTITSKQIIKLVKENIFAIDKNRDALQISVFSLYLAMLDYQNPKDIEKFKFPYLIDSDKNKDTPNFFNNDFFDTEASYNQILKEKKLDFIVGNPPYGGSSIIDDSFTDNYIKSHNISVANKDIVQAFIIRVKDLALKETKNCFIVTSKVLYNLKTKEFRNQFLSQFKINHILELSSVRHEIFESVDVPVSILLYEYCDNKKEIENNEINYISMKPNPYFKKLKILILSKNDFKKIKQKKLIDNNDLWKVLVYGSYLDFNFIKKLKSSYNNIQSLIDDKKLIKYQGFKRKDGNKKIDTTRLKGFDFIDTNSKRKDLKPFYISSNLNKFDYDTVGYTNRKLTEDYTDIYKAPILLFTGGLTNELKQNSAVTYKDVVFTSSVVALKNTNNNTNILKIINGLFYSKYFSYFLLQTASSTGIKQEECEDYEKLSLPYIENQKIISIVSKIEKLKKEHFNTNSSNILNYEQDLNNLIDDLDETVLKPFNLSEEEYSLVDYATNIVIPWVLQKNYDIAFKQYNYDNKEDRKKLEEYVNITINKNRDMYEKLGKFFQATILWDRYAIGVYYKVLDTKQDKEIIWKKEPNINNFFKLTNGQQLENLFIQKDIKGFEEDGYYVIKPNEYKNWHKAIGYLDFYEFKKAILYAGRGA